MSDYPGAVDSFATKVDNVDDVLAAHVNDLQAAVVAVQNELGTDPAGDHATVKARLEGIESGYLLVPDTWTYASATTITVPSGAASRYKKGMGVRLKQSGGTWKYFYIVGVADTLLTITAGTTYTLANEAITDVYVCDPITAVGFPRYFSYTPTVGAGAGTFTTVSASGIFSMEREKLFLSVSIVCTTLGTAAYYVTATLPVNAAAVGIEHNAFGRQVAGGSGDTVLGFVSSGGTTIGALKAAGGMPMADGVTINMAGWYYV